MKEYVGYGINENSQQRTLHIGMVNAKINTFGEPTHDTAYYEGLVKDLLEEGRDDIILLPEYSFLPKSGPLEREEKEGLVRRLQDVSRGKDVLIFPGSFVWKDNDKLYNSTAVVCDGDVLLEYTKRIDGGEKSIARKYNLKPSYGKDSGAFEWKGYKFGLEICADHGKSVLKNLDKASGLDFHVIISYGMRIEYGDVAARAGGYVILCDGSRPETDVRKVSWKRSLVKISPDTGDGKMLNTSPDSPSKDKPSDNWIKKLLGKLYSI